MNNPNIISPNPNAFEIQQLCRPAMVMTSEEQKVFQSIEPSNVSRKCTKRNSLKRNPRVFGIADGPPCCRVPGICNVNSPGHTRTGVRPYLPRGALGDELWRDVKCLSPKEYSSRYSQYPFRAFGSKSYPVARSRLCIILGTFQV